MDWREVWEITTGLQPPVHYFPAFVSVMFLLLVIFVMCLVMHRLSEIFLPDELHVYALDFVKTMAFCTYPFGIIILRKYHSNLIFAVCVVPLNTATALMLDKGEGSPLANWLHFVRGTQSLRKTIVRMAVQMSAGSAGFRFGKSLMTFDLHQDFGENLRQTECFTALKVSFALGIVLELIGTSWDTWFHLQKISDNAVLDKLAKFTNTSVTFCIGAAYTGMFMHPAKAFGLTFGCQGITKLEHVLVYWMGPMIGSYLALKLDSGLKVKTE